MKLKKRVFGVDSWPRADLAGSTVYEVAEGSGVAPIPSGRVLRGGELFIVRWLSDDATKAAEAVANYLTDGTITALTTIGDDGWPAGGGIVDQSAGAETVEEA